MSPSQDLATRVAAVRSFHRFYTREIGLLQETLHSSGYSLTEARIFYEIHHMARSTPKELAGALGLEAAHVGRLVARLQRLGIVRAGEHDGTLALTSQGQVLLQRLERAAHDEVERLLVRCTDAEQERLVEAMGHIRRILEGDRRTFVLREPRAGDLGWVVHRHGVLYGREHGWDSSFEALVAEVVAAFARGVARDVERCIIADMQGEVVGSALVVRHDAVTAKLRLFYVEPTARGRGVGTALLQEAIRFARTAGYDTMALWTASNLLAARRLYQRAGFAPVAEEATRRFGNDLVFETWERSLHLC